MSDEHRLGCPCPNCVAQMVHIAPAHIVHTALAHMVVQAGGFLDIPLDALACADGGTYLSVELELSNGNGRLLLRTHDAQELKRYMANGGR